MGVIQVFHHALSAALYPIAPLYNSKVGYRMVFVAPMFERRDFPDQHAQEGYILDDA